MDNKITRTSLRIAEMGLYGLPYYPNKTMDYRIAGRSLTDYRIIRLKLWITGTSLTVCRITRTSLCIIGTGLTVYRMTRTKLIYTELSENINALKDHLNETTGDRIAGTTQRITGLPERDYGLPERTSRFAVLPERYLYYRDGP